MAMYIVKPWYRKKDDAIYGAEWAGGSDPSWVRTDAAVGFADPNPYYAGMSTTPSSPFDNIMPWAGMRRVTDANAGELVEIPKFYYKWTRDGAKMKLQISMEKFSGFLTSPAHADRGDGVGERDYVYVGRYHCASDYKSKTGYTPISNMGRATARANIHNLGGNIWQNDYALFWTIRMLYLVEFANWNVQGVIGYGDGNGYSKQATGTSDTMPYHTGVSVSSRTTYGVGTQYRYIEDMWGNCYDWIDGIYFNGASAYAINNPSNFSDNANGTYIGNRPTSSEGWLTSFTNPSSISGYEYALIPATLGTASNSGIKDYYHYNSTGATLRNGGAWGHLSEDGLFYFGTYYSASETSQASIGTRLMVLPPSRLSA